MLGDTVGLACNATRWREDRAVSTVVWYHDKLDDARPVYTLDARDAHLSSARHISSSHLANRAFFDVSLNPPLLIVENLTKSDEGAFTCRVEYRDQRAENFVLNLTIASK